MNVGIYAGEVSAGDTSPIAENDDSQEGDNSLNSQQGGVVG